MLTWLRERIPLPRQLFDRRTVRRDATAGGALLTGTAAMTIQDTGAMAIIVADVDLDVYDDCSAPAWASPGWWWPSEESAAFTPFRRSPTPPEARTLGR